MAAEPAAHHGDHAVAGGEAGDVGADGFDDTGDIHSQDLVARAEDAQTEGGHEGEAGRDVAAAGTVVGGADGAGVDLDEDFAGLRRRLARRFDLHDFRWAESAVHGRCHGGVRCHDSIFVVLDSDCHRPFGLNSISRKYGTCVVLPPDVRR